MLLRARIGSQGFCRFNENFVSICSKHIQSFGDELVEWHCLLGFLAIHQFRAHPRWRHFEHSNTAVAKQEALRQHIGVERSFCGRIDSRHSQWHESKARGVVENPTTSAL